SRKVQQRRGRRPTVTRVAAETEACISAARDRRNDTDLPVRLRAKGEVRNYHTYGQTSHQPLLRGRTLSTPRNECQESPSALQIRAVPLKPSEIIKTSFWFEIVQTIRSNLIWFPQLATLLPVTRTPE